MPQRDGLTHNQHHVPQVYLKGFSEDGNRVFLFKLSTYENIKSAVSVRSICVEHDLYEAKNEEGNYLLANHIEKVLGS